MHPKVSEVFNSLSKEYFSGFKEVEENRIYVKTPLTALDHATYLTFSVTGDILRLEFKHIFGTLDVENHRNFGAVATILAANNGTFRMSSAYLAVELIDQVAYTSLQTYRTFLVDWDSAEIASQIDVAFSDIRDAFMAMTTKISAPWPAAIQLLEPRK